MTYKNIKVGDRVRINIRPIMWDSRLCDNNPLNLNFPWEGVVKKIENIGGGEVIGIIGKYGWAMNKIEDFEILNINYEIY